MVELLNKAAVLNGCFIFSFISIVFNHNPHFLGYKTILVISTLRHLCIGFGDMGELWRSPYEMPDFEAACERLWQQVKPLYEQLHAYVRRQLLKLYSNHGHMFADSGHIPAHLLGTAEILLT